MHGCTNPRRQFAVKTQFCTVTHNILGVLSMEVVSCRPCGVLNCMVGRSVVDSLYTPVSKVLYCGPSTGTTRLVHYEEYIKMYSVNSKLVTYSCVQFQVHFLGSDWQHQVFTSAHTVYCLWLQPFR